MSDAMPCPADRIPIRNLSHKIENFVPSLELLSLPSDACPMCQEHYAPTFIHDHSDVAVRLPCTHIVGANCLMKLLSKTAKTASCPVCSTTLMKMDRDRAVDITRYLFFLLQRYHYPMAQKLLRDLDFGGYTVLAHELAAAEQGTPKDEAKIAELRAEKEQYKAHRLHRSTLQYPLEFETKMDATRRSFSMEKWIEMCTIQAVAWVIRHQLSEKVLVQLVEPYLNSEDILAYLDDGRYGSNGDCDMVDVYGIKKRRSWPEVRGMWDMKVNRWSFEFPTQAPHA